MSSWPSVTAIWRRPLCSVMSMRLSVRRSAWTTGRRGRRSDPPRRAAREVLVGAARVAATFSPDFSLASLVARPRVPRAPRVPRPAVRRDPPPPFPALVSDVVSGFVSGFVSASGVASATESVLGFGDPDRRRRRLRLEDVDGLDSFVVSVVFSSASDPVAGVWPPACASLVPLPPDPDRDRPDRRRGRRDEDFWEVFGSAEASSDAWAACGSGVPASTWSVPAPPPLEPRPRLLPRPPRRRRRVLGRGSCCSDVPEPSDPSWAEESNASSVMCSLPLRRPLLEEPPSGPGRGASHIALSRGDGAPGLTGRHVDQRGRLRRPGTLGRTHVRIPERTSGSGWRDRTYGDERGHLNQGYQGEVSAPLLESPHVHVQQEPDPDEVHDHGRPARGHQRQWDAGDRHDADGHPDVHEHLEGQHRHDARG